MSKGTGGDGVDGDECGGLVMANERVGDDWLVGNEWKGVAGVWRDLSDAVVVIAVRRPEPSTIRSSQFKQKLKSGRKTCFFECAVNLAFTPVRILFRSIFYILFSVSTLTFLSSL